MKLKLTDKFVAKALPELRTHITQLFDQAQVGREEKAGRFVNAYDYYLARAPKPLGEGMPDYVEPVVRKAVDRVLPSLLNIFTENEEQAVVFRSLNKYIPTPVADAVNKAINDYFLRVNDGYKLMNRAFTEALVTGDCFVKVYIDEEVFEEEMTIEEWTPTDALMALMEEYPDTDITTLEMKDQKLDDMGAIIAVAKGDLLLKRIERTPRIEFVPFSEVFIDGVTEDIKDSSYICHRRTATLADLIEMGFDEDKVLELTNASSSDITTPLSTEKLLNFKVFVADNFDKDMFSNDIYARNVNLYEHYVRTTLLDKKHRMKLYQVYSSGTEILEINEIERIPFAHGVIEELPGSFWGVSLYDKFKAAQDLLSEHHRTIISNAHFNLYPVYQAVKGNYDRRSLLNLRPGAVIEVEQPGAVSHFPPPQLPAAIQDSYAKAQASAQEDMAISVGQGPIGGVTATAVAASVHNAEMADKKIAKALAYSLIRPMFELIYNIMRDEGLELEVEFPSPEGGEPVAQLLNASELPKRSEFYIDINTANDDALQVQQLSTVMMTAMQLAQVPSSVVTPMNQYNIFKEILKRSDIHNVEDFVTDPTPPTPSPEEQAMQARQQELQLEQMELGNETAKANLTMLVAGIARSEVETEQLIEDKVAQRQRDAEKSLIEFQKLELKREEVGAEIALEESQGRSVSIG